jgi:CubicO group peptidase (beta-lactamase class C family)
VSDAVILEAVERELKKARRRFAAPVVKLGRGAPNDRFDEFTFKKWRRAKIVQLADLLTWRAGLEQRDKKRFPNDALGLLVGSDSKEKTSKAMTTLKNALASLPALAAQIEAQKIAEGVKRLG